MVSVPLEQTQFIQLDVPLGYVPKPLVADEPAELFNGVPVISQRVFGMVIAGEKHMDNFFIRPIRLFSPHRFHVSVTLLHG
jgi:hypothetical protein